MIYSKMMAATRPTKTIHNYGDRPEAKKLPQQQPQTKDCQIAAVESHPMSTEGHIKTLYVRLPDQKTIPMQIDYGRIQFVAQLKNFICNKIGLQDMVAQNRVVLSHLGKSLNFDNSQSTINEESAPCDPRKYHHTTVQVSLLLSGGGGETSSMISGEGRDKAASGDSAAASDDSQATLQASLKKFIKFLGSLDMTDSEIEILAETLNDLQRQRLSRFVKNKLNKTELLSLVSKLSDGQVRKALKDHKFALIAKTEDREQKFFKETLEAIDKKMEAVKIQINQSDSIICRALIKNQTNIFNGLSQKQWCQIFFDFILQRNQLTPFLQILQCQDIDLNLGEGTTSSEASRAQKFWSNLRSDQHAIIFSCLTKTQQKEIIMSPTSIITAIQQVKLWDLTIGLKQAAQIWSQCSDQEKVSGLERLNTESQIGLWQQICFKDQQQFLNFLPQKNQKIQFWQTMSHKLQDQALSILLRHQIVDLLTLLDQESLCITTTMHKNKVLASEENLSDLLTDEKKLSTETFLKYGKSSFTDCSGDQLIQKLVDQQYDGFNSFQNLQPDFSYVQLIENPKIEYGLIALADVQNEIKLHECDLQSQQDTRKDQKAQDAEASDRKSTSLKYDQKSDNLPRTLHPTLVDLECHHVKEWKMEQVNPDPTLNKDKKSVISSFEFLRDDSGHWCTNSLTITNRMSRIYKGQDSDLFIFSRESPPTPESKSENEHQVVQTAANNIKMTVFSFVIPKSYFFTYDEDMYFVKVYEQAAYETYKKQIDADLLAQFRMEVLDQYKEFAKNASVEQKNKAIQLGKQEWRNDGYQKKKWKTLVEAYRESLKHEEALNEDPNHLLLKGDFKEKYYDKTLLKHFRGGFNDLHERSDKFYDLINQLTPEVEGISNEDRLVFFIKIWMPHFSSLLIEDNSKAVNFSQQIYTIQEDSHLGKELLKKEQVKMNEGKQYMDQAPILIKNEGKQFLAYTCATAEQGPSLFFYDLESGRTCAKVSKAELLVDCFAHQSDAGLTLIRYIQNQEILLRSVDFKIFQSNFQGQDQENYYEVAQDDQNLIRKSSLTRQGNSQDNWGNRHGPHGFTFEAFIHVNKHEDKHNFQKSFQVLFKKREHTTHGYYNWCVCYQSYEEEMAIKFKAVSNVEHAEFIMNKQAQTFVVAQSKDHGRKEFWLFDTQVPELDLKSIETQHLFEPTEQSSFILGFNVYPKFAIPVIAKDESFMGLFCQKNNEFSNFFHKQDNKEVPKLIETFQEMKLWKTQILSYPYLFYTGLTPECKEIVVANLADTNQPQKIIQLPDGLQLQNLVRTNLDDRIIFFAYEAHSGCATENELVLRFPSRKNMDYDHHDVIVRRVLTYGYEEKRAHNIDQIRHPQLDYQMDKNDASSQLFFTYSNPDGHFGGRDCNFTSHKIGYYLRSSQNNYYYLEDDPANGTRLGGKISVSCRTVEEDKAKVSYTDLARFPLGDAVSQSYVVETRLINEKYIDFVTVLDRDLNLYSFTVNEAKKCFEEVCEVKNIADELKIDAQWFVFNGKAQLDFESYKKDYKVFSPETLGVVIEDLDYIVFYNIKTQAFSMVDTAHKKFPAHVSNEEGGMKVKWTKNIVGTGFRVMSCTESRTFQSHFVVYPAPESREIDLIGYNSRQDIDSLNFISENLFLVQYNYRDVSQFEFRAGTLKLEEKHWSFIDQSGQLKNMPLELEKNSSVIFSKQTASGSMLIFNKENKHHYVQFNLKGELVYENTQDDEEILQRIKLMLTLKRLRLATPEANIESARYFGMLKGTEDNIFRLSKDFISSSQGRLYRLASLVCVSEGQDRPKPDESFSLYGAVDILKDNLAEAGQQKTNQMGLTVLIFKCRSEAQYRQFKESVFHISKDSLCIFSQKCQKKCIRIINLKRATIDKVEEVNLAADVSTNQLSDDYVRQSQNLTILQDQPKEIVLEDPKSQKCFTWIDFAQTREREIDLRKSIELNQSEGFNLKLNSLQMTTKKLSLKVEENSSLLPEDQNYLQISLPNRVLIYDLSFEDPQECFSCYEMDFFVDPQNFVDLELPEIWLKSKFVKEKWRQVSNCYQRNVFLSKDITYESNTEKFVSIIKNYSSSDVQGLNWLKKRLEKTKTVIQSTSFESTMVTYLGHNVFSIFSQEKSKLKLILEFMHDELKNRNDAEDDPEAAFNSQSIRRIQKILCMPTPKFAIQNSAAELPEQADSPSEKLDKEQRLSESDSDDVIELESQFTTALDSCMYSDVVLRDLFISLSQSSDEYILSDLVSNQKGMKKILENYSTPLDEYLTQQVVETPFTRKIVKLDWPKETKKFVTLKQSNQQIDQDQAQKMVQKLGTENTFEAPVIVKMLRTKWLLQNNQNFAQFSNILQECSSEKIYETEFMKVLVKCYWPQNSRIVIKICFIPWLLYLICTMFLFNKILYPEEKIEKLNDSNTVKYILSVLNIILIGHQFWVESIQLQSLRCKDLKEHFNSVFNVLDVLQLSSTLWITIANLQEGGSDMKEIQRVVAAFSLLIIWFKLFDWLRLFQELAFYITLLFKTFEDIMVFSVLFMAGLLMFGSSMYMLQNNIPHKQLELVTPVTGFFLFDQLLNQYLLSLGAFTFDSYEDNEFAVHPQWYLCWIFIISATFFTQITMLNMLIAIMGNTFDMVIEKKDVFVMKSQLETMSEYADIITKFDDDSHNFLFIVKQVTEEDGSNDDGDWEGGFTFLRKSMSAYLDSVKANITRTSTQQVSQLKNQVRSFADKSREDNREVKAKLVEMQKILDNNTELKKMIKAKLQVLKGELVPMIQSINELTADIK